MLFKELIQKRFTDFTFFYRYLGARIFIALTLSIVVGLMDGLGLAMFIPLLQMVDGSAEFQGTEENIGNIVYFVRGLEYIGLSLNLTTVLLLILFFFSLKGIFRFLEGYYNVILTTNFAKTIRLEAIDLLSLLDYRYFLKIDPGKVQNSLSGEIDRVRLSFVSYNTSIQALISVFVYVTLAFLTNPQFAVLVAVGGSLSNLLYRRLYTRTKQTSQTLTKSNHEFHGLMMQEVQNFKYLRSTGQIQLYAKKVRKSIGNIAVAFKKIGFFNSVLYAAKEPMSITVVVLVIFVQTSFFSAVLGPIIVSLLFFYRSLNQLILFQNSWNNFLNYTGSLRNHQDFIDELKANGISYTEGKSLDQIHSIEIENIDFFFGDKKFIDGLNLTIPEKKTVAFVGPSGSGKTTLSNIITGLLSYDSGRLLVNGVDIKEINLQSYQSKIGYISQEPVVFNDTLFNNVTFWAPKTKENLDRFDLCIQKASLQEFLDSTSEKEDTELGINGTLVSGGQKQRIAIARELYRNSNLLILDEATSALDTATEREIQNYFDELKGHYTMIVIAHRLSTIKSADLIYLMKDGRIVASGDFNTLQELSPEFKNMVALQDFSLAD